MVVMHPRAGKHLVHWDQTQDHHRRDLISIEALIICPTLSRPLCQKKDVILVFERVNCKMNIFGSRRVTYTARGTIRVRRSPLYSIPRHRCRLLCVLR
jgi:hypothetical protein